MHEFREWVLQKQNQTCTCDVHKWKATCPEELPSAWWSGGGWHPPPDHQAPAQASGGQVGSWAQVPGGRVGGSPKNKKKVVVPPLDHQAPAPASGGQVGGATPHPTTRHLVYYMKVKSHEYQCKMKMKLHDYQWKWTWKWKFKANEREGENSPTSASGGQVGSAWLKICYAQHKNRHKVPEASKRLQHT